MTTKEAYWQVRFGWFDWLGCDGLAYGVNLHSDDPYPWDEYLIDTLILVYP